MMEQEKRPYVGYEYKKITVAEENASWYLDCYESFGWEQDDNAPPISGGHMVTLSLKRDRKIINKAELTRLQRNLEACVAEISHLERSRQECGNYVGTDRRRDWNSFYGRLRICRNP